MSEATPIAPRVDAQAVRRFVSVVFDGLPGYVCCRVLAEKGGPDLRPITTFLANDEQLSTALARQCEAAARVSGGGFVAPGTVLRAGSAKAADIAATAIVLVDLDVGDIDAKRAHLVEHLGPPTLEVASGGVTEAGLRKLHLYWRLTQPATGAALAQVMGVRRMIAAKVGGDPAFGRITQPVRIAGSIHAKHRRLSPVEILSELPQSFELEALASAAERMPRLEQEPDPLLPGPARVRSGGLDGVTRFDAITRCIGSRLADMRLGRITRSEAWDQVLAYNGAVLDPPWGEARLEAEFAALERLDLRNHGALVAEPASEDWLAQLLAAEHGQHWKHSSAMAGWLRWSKDHWPRRRARV